MRRRRRKRRQRYENPHRILVVDDEPDLERLMRMRMRRELRRGRFELDFASNGLEALAMLAEHSYDMVLSDINMPRMDGLSLLDQIPKVSPDVRAVIVSAYGDMDNIRTAMNRGAFDFVTKPIDFKDLRVTIERTLKNLADWRAALKHRDELVALESELKVARRMQASILPTKFPSRQGYEVHAAMEPARAVAADFYDVVELEGGKVGIAVADVSGDGVPAALWMMSSRTLLKGAAIGGCSPGAALDYVNKVLVSENSQLMFLTAVYAEFDPISGQMVYACGGQDGPVVLHADGTTSILPHTRGMALGLVPDASFEPSEVRLAAGDIVVCASDGVGFARNSEADLFGSAGVRQALEQVRPATAAQAVRAVIDAAEEFAGSDFRADDVTCLALRRIEAAA